MHFQQDGIKYRRYRAGTTRYWQANSFRKGKQHDLSASAGKRKDLYRPLLQGVPGPGAKGEGTGFIRNAEKWREICVNMDTICENSPVDTSFTLFDRTFEIPAFAAQVGAMRLH